jgi:hypothetical protein
VSVITDKPEKINQKETKQELTKSTKKSENKLSRLQQLLILAMRERKREVLEQNKTIKEKIKNQSGFIKRSLLIVIISGILIISGASYIRIKQYQNYQVKNLLVKINEDVNSMDTIKGEMPKELLEVHEYLISGALGGKLYRVDAKLKDQIMYHGAKTQSVYINPDITLKQELWIPVFYHEVAHNYWHSKNPVKNLEEFKTQLFDSENYAYTVDAQSWDLVTRYYPIKPEELKTELEQRLFKSYSNDTKIYAEMIKGSSEAKD